MAYLYNSTWQSLLDFFKHKNWGRVHQLAWLDKFNSTRQMIETFEPNQNIEHALIPSSEKNKIRVITKLDADYPALLHEIKDPPVFLFLLGKDLVFNQKYVISIIGTRNPTPYGIKISNLLIDYFQHPEVTVISGMADGIDSIVHSVAIKKSLNSIAILGSGVDVCFPENQKKLYKQLIMSGSILSEFPPGTKAKPYYFPMRNRLISGMAMKLIVVEAGIKSGTMITARCALEQGRDVYAIPGSIFTNKSQGCHQLINDGAKIIMGLDELALCSRENMPDLNLSEQKIVKYISSVSPTFLELMHYTDLSTANLLSLLGKLESIGVIIQFNGKYMLA